MNFDELKTTLDSHKKSIIDEVASHKTKTAEELTSLEKKLDEKIALSVKEQVEQHRKMALPGLEGKEAEKFSLSAVVKAGVNNDKWGSDENSQFTKSVIEELHKKSNNGSTGTAGGYLIPDEVSSTIIDLALANIPVMEFNPTVYRGLRGELPMPKLTGRPTAYWVGEEEAPTESTTTYGEIVLRPKTLAALTKVSERILHQSSGVIENIVRNQLVNAFRLELDKAMIRGTGTEKQPKGIVNYAGLTATSAIGTNGGRFLFDKAAEMINNIDEADMLKPTGSFGFLMRPTVKFGLKTERVKQYSGQPAPEGMPVLNPFTSDKDLEQNLNGYKLRTTTLLLNNLVKGSSSTCSNVIFGDWKQLILAMWQGFTIRSSTEAGNSTGSAFTQRQIWITASQDVDVNVMDETGFTVISDAETLKSNW